MVNETNTFIEKQAYDWIVKLETGAMLDGDEERFVDWLSENEQHGVAFSNAEQTWQLMCESDKAAIEQRPNVKHINKSTALHRQLLPLAASFLLLTFILFFGNALWIPITADYYTSTGARAEHVLSDGSVITLNTGSAINVSMATESRNIEIIMGEIYVSVAPDRQRPFVVQAGNMQVTALGTEFIIHKRANQDALVIVTEHSVKVENTQHNTTNLILEVGESVSLDNAQKQFSGKRKVNPLQESAWLKGKYVFSDETLATVVAELSRYHKGKIMIMDNSLSMLTLSGVLDLDEPLTSLQNLTYTLPINVKQITPYLVLIEKG